MRLCVAIVVFVMLACSVLALRTEPMLYAPSLARPTAPTTMPTTAPASQPHLHPGV
jgi:hypothetical protein